MKHTMFERYGMMFEEDCDVIDAALDALLPRPVIRICEIGTYNGATARGMKKFLESRDTRIQYWGMDPSFLVPLEKPFPEAVIFRGKSEELFHLIPSELDLVFVDGNHSRNGVILDIYNYFNKVRKGGFMLFHDTNPVAQGGGYEYTGPHIPQFGIAVIEAMKLIGWPWKPWYLWMEKYPLDHHQNGMQAYRNGES